MILKQNKHYRIEKESSVNSRGKLNYINLFVIYQNETNKKINVLYAYMEAIKEFNEGGLKRFSSSTPPRTTTP